jgi:poly-gamma-glutamate synthesis protein (capsule biosynthesis protein)
MRIIYAALTAAIMLAGCAGMQVEQGNIDKDGAFEIAVTGDIMPGRRMELLIKEKGINYIFEDTAPVLKQCSVVFGNLETPLVREGSGEGLKKNGKKQIYMLSDEVVADGLKSAGYNIVSLANNHMLDYGQKAAEETMQILDSRGILYQGIRKGALHKPNEPAVIEVNGTKLGFLCYSEVSHWKHQPTVNRWGTNPSYFKEIKRDIKNARPKVDLLFVYLHWGKEGKKVQKFQYTNAKKILDMGADAILSSHTHLFQDIELYKGKYILYGLGNFVFDMEEEETKHSAIVKLKVVDKKVAGLSVVPVYINNYRTELVKDEKKRSDFINGLKLINLKESDLY